MTILRTFRILTLGALALAGAASAEPLRAPPPFLSQLLEIEARVNAQLETPPSDKSADPKALPRLGETEDAATPGARVYLDGDAFRERFEGKTLHLRDLGGAYYGSEQFMSGDRSVWTFRGEDCQDGVWTYSSVSREYCFTYGTNGPHCWYMYEEDGVVFAAGAPSGITLEVFDINDAPVGCQADRLS